MNQENNGAELSPVHHLAVNVSDIPRAVKWYQSSFRCEVIFQDKTQAVLQFANIRLQLVLPSMEQPHLGFIRDDAATLGELRERGDGSRSTFLADSSGNMIEIIEKAF
jgi:catechol 2,3-dioxygenase-like lactoylglutathione lyase family enzyme